MTTLLQQGTIVTGQKQFVGDILITNGKIEKIAPSIAPGKSKIIDCRGLLVLPGMIDTHVHFREPGLTHKADITSESKAAVAGGVTTIFDMPNTVPQTLSVALVKEKQKLYAKKSLCNFGIFIGASKDNFPELLKADKDATIPGIKIFMAESTGNMTLFEDEYLEPIFKKTKKMLVLHAEDEPFRLHRLACFTKGTLADAKGIKSNDPFAHFVIRNNMVAALGTKHAVELAMHYKHKVHILHVSAKEEFPFIQRGIEAGLVSAETCPQYLFFTNADLRKHGPYRMMNPILKSKDDQKALWESLLCGPISQITTDHAPHTKEEKDKGYPQAPTGVPGVQYVFPLLLNAAYEGSLTYQQVVRLCCENPARNFAIKKKGYLQAGYDADIVLVNPQKKCTITKKSVLSTCGWTPYEGMKLNVAVEKTFVNGNLVYDLGTFGKPCGVTVTC